MQPLLIYNTLSRQKELFKPITPGRVGMYVCGPTVYGDAHLGHARPAITFDLLFRYLQHIGYKVRYVRNITDVGHLEHDADEGEDKIAKKARLEQLEPMEVAQYYTNRFHDAMAALNCLPPSIEPHASGHIMEQQQLVREILENGYAYESNGSIYFDVEKYDKDHHYGILSGRSLENIKDASRELAGVGEKRNQADFALWKAAQPEHIMRWPWVMPIHNSQFTIHNSQSEQTEGSKEIVNSKSEIVNSKSEIVNSKSSNSKFPDGFPGWHCECTAMGRKYLGSHFDIHGGGLDLVFPHHECEIAQAVASQGDQMVHYWMHNNMITIDGKKMGKSYNNFITLPQFFAGEHERLERGYSPMTIRFFILQAHYRSTVDFSNEALQSAEKGLQRLMDGWKNLQRLQEGMKTKGQPQVEMKQVDAIRQACYDAMNDDLASPTVISQLFEACRLINTVLDKKASITAEVAASLCEMFHTFAFDILGLKEDSGQSNKAREEAFGHVVDMVLAERQQAKAEKNWALSDKIRDDLSALGFEVKDTKDGQAWTLNK